MQLRIGIAEAASRELVIELSPAEAADSVSQRLAAGAAAEGGGLVWFVDRHGARFGVPFDRINYVEFDE